MRIFGIDPGVRTFGWATLLDGKITSAAGMKSEPNTKPIVAAARYWGALEEMLYQHSDSVYVIECMEWRPGSVQRPSDLLGVQLVGAYFAGRLAEMGAVICMPKPSRWKHPQPKHIHHNFLSEKIEGWEVIEQLPKNQREHAADAAGLAWWLYNGGEERV